MDLRQINPDLAVSPQILPEDVRALAEAGFKVLINNPLVRRVAVYTWNFQPWLTRETLDSGVSAYLSKSLPYCT